MENLEPEASDKTRHSLNHVTLRDNPIIFVSISMAMVGAMRVWHFPLELYPICLYFYGVILDVIAQYRADEKGIKKTDQYLYATSIFIRLLALLAPLIHYFIYGTFK